MLKTTRFDVSEYLKSEDDIAAYLNAAFEDGDPALIAAALGDVAKARGMSQVAREANVSRESLYRSLSADGNPELGTVMKVAKSFGLRLTVAPFSKRKRKRSARSRRAA